MAKFLFSAFADEASPDILEQIDACKANGIEYIELRNVNGKNISNFTVEEAKELKAACEAHPELTYMAAENCCYWAFIETWKKMREDGLFGDIAYAEAEYLHALDPNEFSPTYYPEGHWRTYQPAIRYLTHELGPLLYVMDDRCVSVTCLEADINYDPYTPERKETGVALFKTKKGAVIRLLVSFGAYTSYDHNYRICGTRGTVETDRRAVVDKAHTLASLHSIPGTFDANALGSLISKKVELAVAEKEKEFLLNTPNPNGGTGNPDEKSDAEKLAEKIGGTIGGDNKVSTDVVSKYL